MALRFGTRMIVNILVSCVDANRSGVAQETVQNMAHRVVKTMTETEARLVLGVNESTPWEEVLKVGFFLRFHMSWPLCGLQRTM